MFLSPSKFGVIVNGFVPHIHESLVCCISTLSVLSFADSRTDQVERLWRLDTVGISHDVCEGDDEHVLRAFYDAVELKCNR